MLFLHSNVLQKQSLSMEDYTFHAVIKKGRVISTPNDLYVEGLDFSKAEYVFRLSLQDSSVIEDSWPQFSSCGLLGKWKLNSNGLIKFLEPFESSDAEHIKEFLIDKKNQDFIRKYYIL